MITNVDRKLPRAWDQLLEELSWSRETTLRDSPLTQTLIFLSDRKSLSHYPDDVPDAEIPHHAQCPDEPLMGHFIERFSHVKVVDIYRMRTIHVFGPVL